jgi:hypothetical protein
MRIEIENSRPPAPLRELVAAEQELERMGWRIPPSYKEFLAHQDGGEPVRMQFAFTQHGRAQESLVRTFLGVAPAPNGDIVETLELLGDRMLTGVLPIGNDPVGNLICLDGRDGRDGPVLFWDHERETEPPSDANLFELAPDLPTFLESLTPPDELPPTPPPPSRLRRLFGRG